MKVQALLLYAMRLSSRKEGIWPARFSFEELSPHANRDFTERSHHSTVGMEPCSIKAFYTLYLKLRLELISAANTTPGAPERYRTSGNYTDVHSAYMTPLQHR